jgi:hypothetical protein
LDKEDGERVLVAALRLITAGACRLPQGQRLAPAGFSSGTVAGSRRLGGCLAEPGCSSTRSQDHVDSSH